MDSFRYTLRLIPVNRFGPAGSYRTKTVTAGADISQYHKSGCTFSPAFTHIRTIAAFTNSMQLMCINQIAHMLILLANRQFYPKPVWLLRFLFHYPVNYR